MSELYRLEEPKYFLLLVIIPAMIVVFLMIFWWKKRVNKQKNYINSKRVFSSFAARRRALAFLFLPPPFSLVFALCLALSRSSSSFYAITMFLALLAALFAATSTMLGVFFGSSGFCFSSSVCFGMKPVSTSPATKSGTSRISRW